MKVSLTVNGKRYQHDVEPRTLLVHHLRDTLGLTGTHIGCDTSQCGACTIVVNGEVVKSCTVFAVQADGASITLLIADGVLGSRTGSLTVEATFFTGSRIGMKSVLFSVAP